jgi:hypothetical protein
MYLVAKFLPLATKYMGLDPFYLATKYMGLDPFYQINFQSFQATGIKVAY